MKTAGQMLQETRLSKRLDYADVARITKIRPQFLEIIENDNYKQLPSGAVAKGFIRNYAEFLGLKPDYISAIFRRDFVENERGEIIPRGMANPINKVSIWTPKTTVIAGVIALFLALGIYLIYQFNVLVGPPSLKLTEPAADQVVDTQTIVVSGTTDPEATILVNSQPIALDKGGSFFVRLPLVPGENKIIVVATSKSKKTTTIERKVTLTSTQ